MSPLGFHSILDHNCGRVAQNSIYSSIALSLSHMAISAGIFIENPAEMVEIHGESWFFRKWGRCGV
jgi:hypothetical protein